MAQPILTRIVVDCSVVVKWHLPYEPYAPQAWEVLQDWQANAVDLHAPDLLHAEIVNTFLQAVRRGRLLESEAVRAI